MRNQGLDCFERESPFYDRWSLVSTILAIFASIHPRKAALRSRQCPQILKDRSYILPIHILVFSMTFQLLDQLNHSSYPHPHLSTTATPLFHPPPNHLNLKDFLNCSNEVLNVFPLGHHLAKALNWLLSTVFSRPQGSVTSPNEAVLLA